MNDSSVVISVKGGVVNAVCTNRPDIKVYLADFDNLEASPHEDCGIPYPVDSLDDFRSAVRDDLHRFPGIKKLLKRFSKTR